MIRGEEVARRREYSHLVAGPERTTRETCSNAGSYVPETDGGIWG